MESDPVNSPDHYTEGEIECIDAIRSALGPDGFRSFCRGNALKYLWRMEHKGREEDLRKAVWYSRMANGDDPRLDGEKLSSTDDQRIEILGVGDLCQIVIENADRYEKRKSSEENLEPEDPSCDCRFSADSLGCAICKSPSLPICENPHCSTHVGEKNLRFCNLHRKRPF